MKDFREITILFFLLLTLTGCSMDINRIEEDIIERRHELTERRHELALLEKELTEIGEKVVDAKIEKGEEKYVLTIEIRQSHITLDIEQHLKNEMNAIQLQMPVDKEYYDSFEVGDKIDDSFRFGSFLLTGTFGNWSVKVIDKAIK